MTAFDRAAAPGPRRPSSLLLLSEPLRSVLDLGALTVSAPQLARAPRGDGHRVLVIPGLLASDASTLVLRRFLDRLGYRTAGWGLGVNTGPTSRVVRKLPLRLRELAGQPTAGPEGPEGADGREAGSTVSVIGWSLGGIFARALAVRSPELVRQVITLGSPYASTVSGQTHADAAYRMLSRRHAGDAAGRGPDVTTPLTVPTTSVYSRMDGIVSWRVCREDVGERRESIAVPASHLGFGHSPTALWVVADRLAQDPGDWRPFVPPRHLRGLFTVDSHLSPPGRAGTGRGARP
ncbi:pimeloyl-ACP methyl ester carboxylesterase [Phycicoccus badiiscoriae]|uniref:Pimeloyl-ACP methyl ester carboxylesterase n=1 Tax=Pedococcus badiiscoriae TaxID=642776 RepID=A0A852W9H2_9MICO|nr:alpha/beta hydrolase [Pedococcus badiiscoriae]NYG05857.1 pimeloyl-ACP methyl ester carboxylesterase [Pedococcus badiiscoriae]